MTVEYSKNEISELVDGKLSQIEVNKFLSNYKDADRFQKYLEILQERVTWKEKIILPYALHLYIVQKGNKERVVKCDCGHEFGDYKKNWKLQANIHIRNDKKSLEEIYPQMMHCDPKWMELREYFCPGCNTLLEVEALPPGYPIVFDFEPDLELFYEKWLGKKL